ncbi:hypothetical protein DICVIV_03816 [Dictyocaulus viviparus]|uniref:Uncharacterized protein n=1 Tax=Dictyocaulus viviparus TaxID=29172 RepID=A0A0D8XZW8_DICVI|nr:hypothetical protein DICVIV_03816 [Dictyocaulus viviparus]
MLLTRGKSQTCSSAVLVVIPFVLFTIFAVWNNPMFSYSIPLFLGSAFLPILNPYIIVFNVRVFRKSFFSMISLKSKNVGPISHISSNRL